MDYDLGNVGAAGVIEGLGKGMGDAAKNLYTIQMARKQLDMKQQELDNETSYKKAQIDYLEGRGELAGAQAESYHFLIDRAQKTKQRQLDVADDHIDNAHMQVQGQAQQYRQMLNQALQTPQGQDYVAGKMTGTTDADQDESGSAVVNNINPAVGGKNIPSAQPNPTVPVSSQGVATQLNKLGGATPTKSGTPKRNASLMKALGKVNDPDMAIDNRQDAEYALNKYYGPDWQKEPDAVNFMNAKFGTPGAPSGAAGTAVGGPQGQAPQTDTGNPTDLVSVTGPDGTPYKLPRANLQKAIQRGYRVRQ